MSRGRRPLKGGAIRLLGNHNGERGRAFRRAYDALSEEFDLSSRLARLEASRVALAWANLETTSRALEHARKLRARGRTTRPISRDLERLQRRQGIDDSAYSTALDKLRALVGTRKPSSLADLVATHQTNGTPS